ncbi:MAG: 4Fe-4S binding protein [Candidatus Eisenbacteria bacterium]
MTYRSNGVLGRDELHGVPSEERLRRGPVIVIECVENIPCDPCVSACPRGAISIEGDVNGTPSVDPETCDGCGVCLSACPGLAIFSIDASGNGDTATVRIPYEYRPLPEVGEMVTAVDRAGEAVGAARVTRVANSRAMDRTPVVSLEVPRERAMDVRHFVMKKRSG